MSEEYLTRREAATRLNVSERTLSRHDVEWGIPPLKVHDRLTNYRVADIDAYLERRKNQEEIALTPRKVENTIRKLLAQYPLSDESRHALEQAIDCLAKEAKGEAQ
jgi:hypothetical protein